MLSSIYFGTKYIMVYELMVLEKTKDNLEYLACNYSVDYEDLSLN